ncbi:TerC family protein [Demequina sp. SYSU T00192]|uniref:TerC family protein n=1 Tax=Demequina litoralis TaxID=3051660 RepID=A0ABT8G574_9MICO|nr:TerC family protein [Demequina sp. SYSU T00192]MDN4474284.1 TerC family protein [Demequina sp. SYSU T00192]
MESGLVWAITIAGIVGLFVFDFVVVVAKPHVPSFRESAWWSVFYIALAFAFGASMWWWNSPAKGTEFIAGFITEKSLSIDNLFVFLVILSRFAVPPKLRQRVLLIGIAIALVLRGVFIAAGAAALSTFSWTFYLFGAFLLYTAIVIAREGGAEEGDVEYKENLLVRTARRLLPVTDGYRDGRFVIRDAGRRAITPLLLVVLAIGGTDVLFALDSIPAIFGLTQDPYIVFTANAFALLGLRQLFFLVDGLLARLVYLSYGLSVVLGFIGVKLVLEALHENSLPFLNGGEPFDVWVPSSNQSLLVIIVVIGVAALASVRVTRGGRDRRSQHAAHPEPVESAEDD